MIKHYLTKYRNEQNERKAVSWIQVSLFGKCFCLFQREISI